jgi:branched-chain amino acid transport system permease protein
MMQNRIPESAARIALKFGLLGSVVALYVSAIGMVEAFSERSLIGDSLSLGYVILAAGSVGAGILTARSLRDRGSPLRVLGYTFLSGAVSSSLLLVLLGVIVLGVIQPNQDGAEITLRVMFVNLSPQLAEILTFGLGNLLGALFLILFCTLMGGVGGAAVLMRDPLRIGLVSGVILTLSVGVFSETVTQILQQISGRVIINILFAQKSIHPLSAVGVFALGFALAYFGVPRRSRTRWQQLPDTRQKQGRRVFFIGGILLLLMLPWLTGLFLSQALFLIGLYILMGLGLNIVVGYAGLLDLGYVAFFAFGAYVMGILTTTTELGITNLTFWTALPICVAAGVLWGLLLGFPVLRLRGDYLAIVTLGFGEIVRILFTSDWLAPIQGGPQGVLKIPNPDIFGFTLDTPQTMYYLVLLGAILAGFVTIRLRDARLGRQWMSMREDEDVSEAMGINLVSTKLLAFAIGAGFSALAGAILAARQSTIFPHSFNLIISINVLAGIIVGGLGSIPGVIVGMIILVGMPELLREFTEYRFLMYGILLIVVMLVRPEGFLPEPTRKRELHSKEPGMLPVEAAPLEPASAGQD